MNVKSPGLINYDVNRNQKSISTVLPNAFKIIVLRVILRVIIIGQKKEKIKLWVIHAMCAHWTAHYDVIITYKFLHICRN